METAVIKYDITDKAIDSMKAKYDPLKIINIKDMAGYEMVRAALADVRTKRTDVEKKRKDLKADALAWGRKVDAEAKRITLRLMEIETPLQIEKARIDAEVQRIKEEKAEKERERIRKIKDKIDDIRLLVFDTTGKSANEISQLQIDLAALSITEEEYQEFFHEAATQRTETMAILKRAEDSRRQWEKEEADRTAREEELKKKEKEIRAREAAVKEQEEKAEVQEPAKETLIEKLDLVQGEAKGPPSTIDHGRDAYEHKSALMFAKNLLSIKKPDNVRAPDLAEIIQNAVWQVHEIAQGMIRDLSLSK